MAQHEQPAESEEQRLIARFRDHDLIPRDVRAEVERLEAHGRYQDALRLILDAKDP